MILLQCAIMAIFLGMLSNNYFILNAQTEKAPSTLGQPAYPSSGPTRNRSDVMGGASSASKASNFEGRKVPSETPLPDRQEEKKNESFKRGPYNQEGEYKHMSPDEDSY